MPGRPRLREKGRRRVSAQATAPDETIPVQGPGSPLISVIVPFLNAEQYIQAAVQSVLAQTYRNWELLLIDDGSSDGSTEFARGIAGQFPSAIRYHAHEGHRNLGMSATRNVGITLARGELVAFLDSDDVWLPEKLERQVSVLGAHPGAGLVFNSAWYVRDGAARQIQPIRMRPGRVPGQSWIASILASDDNAACPSAVLMRRALAEDVGGFEDSFSGHLQLYEDQVMWCKVATRSGVVYDREPLILYRIHAESISGSSSYAARLDARLRFLEWLRSHLRANAASSAMLQVMVDLRTVETVLGQERRVSGAGDDRPARAKRAATQGAGVTTPIGAAFRSAAPLLPTPTLVGARLVVHMLAAAVRLVAS
jgi:glycosyltransferase involved in cell wall biosynthesis